jgi:hypothetical protein
MRRALRALLGLVCGYAVGVGLGLLLVAMVSGNTHDKSVEMATTSALVTGPLGALVGLVLGLATGRHRANERSRE